MYWQGLLEETFLVVLGIGMQLSFNPAHFCNYHTQVVQVLLSVMYLNAAVHPLIYGFFIKDVRTGLKDVLRIVCTLPQLVLR